MQFCSACLQFTGSLFPSNSREVSHDQHLAFVAAAAVTALALFGAGLPAVHAQDFKLKVGNPWPNKHPATEAMNELFADIKARSGAGCSSR
ncbi:MAG: hypothetical protein IPO58_11790 [Betaproteobacteria bacterium]|nr:hypothetical protein [Betaproteobacteria bacterium]